MKPTPFPLLPSLCIDELINHVLRIYSITDSFTNDVNCINKYQKERDRERERKEGGLHRMRPNRRQEEIVEKRGRRRKEKEECDAPFFFFF